MPLLTSNQRAQYMQYLYQFSAIAAFVSTSYFSLYMYKHDATVREENDKRYIHKDEQRYLYDKRDLRLVEWDEFNTFKQNNNSRVNTQEANLAVHKAEALGPLRRLEDEVRALWAWARGVNASD